MAEDQLTSEELQQGQAVAQAGAEAAAAEPDPAKRKQAASRAARQRAQELKIDLTEDHANMIASAIIVQMEQRGAFDAPPEPVAAPAPVAAGGEPVEQQQQQAPVRKSFAEKFRS
ncbi:MAG TPA: hypothetical protein VFI54_06380 [Solirubrobacteraceae bacterium]|nr:hypothetical protein [Solirubrobacteraceae bacterium]